MDYLAKRNLIVPDTRKDLLRNDLVLVVPAAQKRAIAIGPGFDLARAARRRTGGSPWVIPRMCRPASMPSRR